MGISNRSIVAGIPSNGWTALSPSTRLRRLQVGLLSAAPIVFAALALVIGKKTGWDLFNYHWYNPYAFLNDRFGFDVAVAHHATYYNPLSDLPLYLLTTRGPAWLGGVFMGAMAGITVGLIGVLCYLILPIASPAHRTWVAAALAGAGAFGAGAFQEIGDPANDIPAAIGIFAALIIIVWQLNAAKRAAVSKSTSALMIVAGVTTGIAIALKLTIAVYAVGIVGGLLMTGSVRERIARSAWFAIGASAGLSIFGGFWMLKLWRYSGNPFFPYFNGLFHSHLLMVTDYRDRNFAPHGIVETVLFPYFFTIESRNVSESIFRDAHILLLYLLLPITAIVRFARRKYSSTPIGRSTQFLFWFAAFSYLAWLTMFDIYRYLIPLEMLAPLLIALAFTTWPMRSASQWAATVALLVIAQLFVRVDLSDRQTWQGRYVDVFAPEIKAPDRTMILMTGHAPMAYVIPYFAPQIPFVRIDSWLVQGSDRTTGLARTMRQRVAAHAGAMFVLFEKQELEDAVKALASYGLQIGSSERTADDRCEAVESNINIPLKLCEVVRRSDL